MKNANSYFIKELKRQYSSKFFWRVLILILVIVSPVFFVSGRVSFDPAEFVNTYLSTVFTSVLLALILQIVELYRASIMNYSQISNLLQAIEAIQTKLKIDIMEEAVELKSIGNILEHYRVSILTLNIYDRVIRERLILLYSNPDLNYIIESLKAGHPFSSEKRLQLQSKIDALNVSIFELKHIL